MIRMFVGDQYGIQACRLDLQQIESAFDLPGGKTTVDQDPDMPGFDQVGIALTATAQAGKPHGSA